MARKLKTGIVGAGVFGAFHAAKHAASGRSALVGVHDADGARSRAVADKFGAADFASLDALLGAVEAVVVATPARSHFEIARAALTRGLHVYVEKPLAMTGADAAFLVALAAERGCVLQVGHQERFVLSALGEPRRSATPLSIELARCGPPSGRGEDVSVVYDLMIHDLDIARAFGMGDINKVSASGDSDETIATLIFDGGRQASFLASRRAEDRRRLLKAAYEDGVLEIDFLARTVSDTRPGAKTDAVARAFDDPLGVSVEAFIASVLDGSATLVDGAAGRRAIEWAVLIEEARDRLARSAKSLERMIA